MFLAVWQGSLSCCKSPLPLENMVAMKGVLSLIHMNARTQCFPAKHCPQHHTAFSDFNICSVVHSSASDGSHGIKKNVIHRSGHFLLFFHMPVLMPPSYRWSFWQWTAISMGTLLGLCLCSPIVSQLWCTVCSNTFLL